MSWQHKAWEGNFSAVMRLLVEHEHLGRSGRCRSRDSKYRELRESGC